MDLTRRRILACAPAIILTPGVLMPVREVLAPAERILMQDRVLTLDDLRRASQELSAQHGIVRLDAHGTWALTSIRFVTVRVKRHEDWMKNFERRA